MGCTQLWSINRWPESWLRGRRGLKELSKRPGRTCVPPRRGPPSTSSGCGTRALPYSRFRKPGEPRRLRHEPRQLPKLGAKRKCKWNKRERASNKKNWQRRDRLKVRLGAWLQKSFARFWNPRWHRWAADETLHQSQEVWNFA